MLTIGFLKESYFISYILRKEIWVDITIDEHKLSLKLSPNSLAEIFYLKKKIWAEKLEGVESNFGIESLDSIQKIIKEINSGNELFSLKYPSPIH